MNCPGHIQIFNQGIRSYKDLPIRFAEFGKVHRYEPSGALHGLMRVRAFNQDDAHIFITEEQITEESVLIIKLLLSIYKDFGFEDVAVKFADRPPKRVGSDEIWDRSEKALKAAAAAAGIECDYNPGEGAFYGPKLEFHLRDAIGRTWQCGTLQVDLNLPGRLGRHLYRRAQPAADPRDAAPGDFWLSGALFRHSSGASRRQTARLAGPDPGRGDDHHRPPGRLRSTSCGNS